MKPSPIINSPYTLLYMERVKRIRWSLKVLKQLEKIRQGIG